MSKCTKLRDYCLENNKKKVVFKDLNIIQENIKYNFSWNKGDYNVNKNNTALLDDSPYKVFLNPISLCAKSLIFIQKQFYCFIDVLTILNELPDFTATYINIYSHI